VKRASIILSRAASGLSNALAGCGSDRAKDAQIVGAVEVCGEPFLDHSDEPSSEARVQIAERIGLDLQLWPSASQTPRRLDE